MTDSFSCARSNPARPLLELLLRSLSIRALPPLPGLVRADAHDIALRCAVENCRRALTGEAPLHVIGLDKRLM